MRNYDTLSLAARVSCLREHHIYNDSNAVKLNLDLDGGRERK